MSCKFAGCDSSVADRLLVVFAMYPLYNNEMEHLAPGNYSDQAKQCQLDFESYPVCFSVCWVSVLAW